MKEIEILGRIYALWYTEDKTELNEDNFAQVNYSDRTITVLTKEDDFKFSKEYIRDMLLHELAHAFLYETGNNDINDERHVEVLGKFVTFIERTTS